MASLGGRAGALSGGSKAPGIVEGDALVRVASSTPQDRDDSAACAAAAPYHRLCT